MMAAWCCLWVAAPVLVILAWHGSSLEQGEAGLMGSARVTARRLLGLGTLVFCVGYRVIFITKFNAWNISRNMIMFRLQTYGLLTLIGRRGNKIRIQSKFPGCSGDYQVQPQGCDRASLRYLEDEKSIELKVK